LYTPKGEQVLAFSAGHNQPVTNLAVSPTQDDYFVATADAGGAIRVHKVNVRQRRPAKEQKKGSTDEKVSQFLDSQLNVTAQFTTQMQVPAGSNGEPAQLTALAMASQQGAKYLVAGDDEGKVSIFKHNGTFVGKVDASVTPGARVEALTAHMSNLMFHVGYEWGFINLERLSVHHMDCPEFEGRVTSAVSDSQQASRVVVADEEGTIWVLNVKDKKKCRVEHTFPKGVTIAPIDLASIRGFSIALKRGAQDSNAATVLAINMSHVGRRRDSLTAAPSAVVWRSERQGVRDWTVNKRYQQGDLMAFLSEDGKEIEVFELLMQVYQPPAETDSFSKYKPYIIGIGILVVFGFQYMKLKGKAGDSGSAGLSDSAFGGADAALRNKQRRGNEGH